MCETPCPDLNNASLGEQYRESEHRAGLLSVDGVRDRRIRRLMRRQVSLVQVAELDGWRSSGIEPGNRAPDAPSAALCPQPPCSFLSHIRRESGGDG